MIAISIVIVNWNTKHFLKGCLDSIPASCGELSYEVVVVDNASTDGSVEFLQTKYPGVELIKNTTNKGYAKACNQGADKVSGKYIFILNPDTVLSDNCISKLYDFSEKESWVGIVGPQLLGRNGKVQNSVRRFPTLGRMLIKDTIIGFLWPWGRKERLVWKLPLDKPSSIEQVSGAAFLIKREIWNGMGGMDNEFFMFYEEVDLCRRVKETGYNIFYFPEAKISHLGGGSRHQVPTAVFYYSLRSMFIYFDKCRSKKAMILFRLIYKPLFITKFMINFIFLSSKKKGFEVKKDFFKTKLWDFLFKL